MLQSDAISTFPRSFKEKVTPFDADRSQSPSYRKAEVNELKFTLNQAMFERQKSHASQRKRSSRYDPRRNTTGLLVNELRFNHINSPAVHTVKDQEWLIQDLKKENFDLKLRLFMEQKEREKLLNGSSRQTDDLEADLTEALDELEHAMDKENQLTHELNAARRREKSLATKLKRLERVCQHQEEDIIRMSVELENLKMEFKDSGIASPSVPRNRLSGRAGGRVSPTSDLTDRYSDRLSAGYPDRLWDRYSDRMSDRGSDSGSYVTTPHERKTFFGERFPDDMSTSDESEVRPRGRSSALSDVERNKRREKLLSRRVRHYQDAEENGDHEKEDGHGPSGDRVGDANESPDLEALQDGESKPSNQERAVDVAPDLLKSTAEGQQGQKKAGFSRPRWLLKKGKGNKQTSKSMDELNSIGRIDIKNIHKKNKKYNFWGCVRARESINENIRSEYAPVKRPQVKSTEGSENAANGSKEAAPVDYI